MKTKQPILLFLALLLPIAVFLFLKMFGRNEFRVPALFVDALPEISSDCSNPRTLPYRIQSEETQRLGISIDSLACVVVSKGQQKDRLSRVREEFTGKPLQFFTLTDSTSRSRECIFLLQEPFDVALVDRRGQIRGQYNSSERDEVDRLITEIAIIFKEY
jgi:hypothetical protein